MGVIICVEVELKLDYSFIIKIDVSKLKNHINGDVVLVVEDIYVCKNFIVKVKLIKIRVGILVYSFDV